jgi:hypothetical protein
MLGIGYEDKSVSRHKNSFLYRLYYSSYFMHVEYTVSPLQALTNLLYMVIILQAYQTSHYVMPSGGIFLSKWRSTYAGSSDGKLNVQSACFLNTLYNYWVHMEFYSFHSFCNF